MKDQLDQLATHDSYGACPLYCTYFVYPCTFATALFLHMLYFLCNWSYIILLDFSAFGFNKPLNVPYII